MKSKDLWEWAGNLPFDGDVQLAGDRLVCVQTGERLKLDRAVPFQVQRQAKGYHRWRTLATFYDEETARDYCSETAQGVVDSNYRILKAGEVIACLEG